MIDLHSHILHGIDDGSVDIDMSLDIANLYVKNGIDKVVATPHYIEQTFTQSPEEVRILVEELNKEMLEAGIPLEIYPGNEIYISPDIVNRIVGGQVLTLNDSDYALIELPRNEIPLYTESIIYELRKNGITPIIAHPERYKDIIKDPNLLYEFIRLGALAQLSLRSLEGAYGNKIKNTARKLLDHDLIHLVATDTHSNKKRSPKIKKSLKILWGMVQDEDYYDLITEINPEKILNNELIEAQVPVPVKKRFKFF